MQLLDLMHYLVLGLIPWECLEFNNQKILPAVLAVVLRCLYLHLMFRRIALLE